jgi:hypothetical protein
MRGERNFRGGGRGRGGNNRNRRGGGRGGNNRGRGRGGYNRGPRDLRQSSESGNQRERIAVESGALVMIDQFMLANPQLIDRLKDTIDDGPEAKNTIIEEFGGVVVEVTPGTYRIERDPFAFSIIIHPEGEAPETAELQKKAGGSLGHVFVDTRCLAMIDRELLDDGALLEKYQQLWFGGQDKACRDLLRDNGGAVRYGFDRHGDALGVYLSADDDIVALWPDVAEAA